MEDAPAVDVQGGEEVGDAAADVLVLLALGLARFERDGGLGLTADRDLGLLVHRQHQGVVRGLRYSPQKSPARSQKSGSSRSTSSEPGGA